MQALSLRSTRNQGDESLVVYTYREEREIGRPGGPSSSSSSRKSFRNTRKLIKQTVHEARKHPLVLKQSRDVMTLANIRYLIIVNVKLEVTVKRSQKCLWFCFRPPKRRAIRSPKPSSQFWSTVDDLAPLDWKSNVCVA